MSRLGALLDRLLPADLREVADATAPHRGRALVAMLLASASHALLIAPLVLWQLRDNGFFMLLGSAAVLLTLGMTLFCLWVVKRFAALTLATYAFGSIITLTLVGLILATGGFAPSPFTIHLLLVPMLLFLINGRRAGLLGTAVVVAVGATLAYVKAPAALPHYSMDSFGFLRLSTWLISAAALLGCVWYLDLTNRKLTARIERERDLAQFAAAHDPLTQLLNRSVFNQRLEAAARRTALTGTPFTLMLLDLDGFKAVNDTRGHPVGDQLLCILAQRIQAVVRHADVVARLGGDEFAVLLDGSAQRDVAERIADQLLAALSMPVVCGRSTDAPVEPAEVRVSGSIGVAFCPLTATDATELIRCADIALYRAKAAGKNRVAFPAPNQPAPNEQSGAGRDERPPTGAAVQ